MRNGFFHTQENDFEYIRGKVNSGSINCRCIYYRRKGVLCSATINIICEPELIKYEKKGNKKIFSLIESDEVFNKTLYKF